MKKNKFLFIAIIMVALLMIGIFTFCGGGQPVRDVIKRGRLYYYDFKINYQIARGNRATLKKLEKRYPVFVNGVWVDTGYEWDGTVYAPIRTVGESLNWEVNWLPERKVMQLLKNNQEVLVDIVNFFGKAYVKLETLSSLLKLDTVRLDGGKIKINVPGKEHLSLNGSNMARFNFYIDGMKMTENAVEYQGEKYVPVRIFALSLGRIFRYDLLKGRAYIDSLVVEPVFIEGEAYAPLEQLKKLLNTGDIRFEFKPPGPHDELLPVISKGPREKVIALTFDDYLGGSVYKLLNTLDAYQVKATFFLIGNSIEQQNRFFRDLVGRGHQVANHTWDHLNSHTLTDDELRAQLISTQLVFRRNGGTESRYFRPPGGYYSDNIVRIAQDIGLRTVLWSLNSNDADPANSPEDIKTFVTFWAHPGAIVVMHTERDSTIQALPAIITALKERGYRFVTLDEMVKMK